MTAHDQATKKKVPKSKKLTDRYVYAVTRSLPESQRADIERELRASIGDAVDGRVEGGATVADAELAALTELGDPMRLAGEYAGRPAWLIGPRYFFDYLRLLKVLFAIVLPIVMVVLFVVNFIAGGVGPAFAGAIGGGISVAAHLFFWSTLFFAVLERSADAKRDWRTWTPDLLPDLPEGSSTGRGKGTVLGELIGSLVFLGFFAFAVVWQQFNSVFEDAAGIPIPVINPELWSFWLPFLLVGIVLEVAFAAWLYASKRWTWPLAIVHVPLTLVFNIAAIWLFSTHQVWNTEFFDQFNWGAGAGNTADTIAVVVIILATVGDLVDAFVKTVRANRAAARDAAAVA